MNYREIFWLKITNLRYLHRQCLVFSHSDIPVIYITTEKHLLRIYPFSWENLHSVHFQNLLFQVFPCPFFSRDFTPFLAIFRSILLLSPHSVITDNTKNLNLILLKFSEKLTSICIEWSCARLS